MANTRQYTTGPYMAAAAAKSRGGRAAKKMRTPYTGMRQVYKGEIEEKLQTSIAADLTGFIMPHFAAAHKRENELY